MKVIILAAGQGQRLLPLTKNLPKCLMPVGGSTVLERLIKQLIDFGIRDITVVVGYKANYVIDQIKKNIKHKIIFVENDKYREDVNILSLSLALSNDISPFLLFEADCIFEDKCFDLIFCQDYNGKSVWYSAGDFIEGQYGGIIKSNTNGGVTDVRIVDGYKNKYKGYKKMIGVLKIGEEQVGRYTDYLLKACQSSIKQYYHMPWINHIDEFESYLCDLGHLKLTSFNTVEDYYKVKEMFSNETG